MPFFLRSILVQLINSLPGCDDLVMDEGSCAAPLSSALITLRSSRFDRISFCSCCRWKQTSSSRSDPRIG